MIESFFQELALGLEKFGTGAYLLVFLIVLLETVVVLGQFIPGSLFLIMVGFLCYMRVFDFSAMLASVLIAHLSGEFINYALGRVKGRSLFHPDSRFFKPKFLDMAQSRFDESGAKLLITGQFLGFLRPFISLAAGASHYSLIRFAIAELIACSIWAFAHLALGFFFGASWQKAVGYMRDFTLVLIVAIPLAMLSGWFVRQLLAMSGSLYKFLERLNRLIRRRPWFRRLNERHPRTFAWLERRISLSQSWGLGATFGFTCVAALMIACLVILGDVHSRDNWYTFDLSMVNLLAQLRTPGGDKLFGAITHLGTAPVVTVTVVLSALACFFARQHKSLFVIVGSVVVSMLASELMEIIFRRARPEIALHLVPAHGFSFPSGHATVAFALFGSLYYWLWNHPGILKIRATLAFLLLLAAFLVGFSRVYLGVHFPSDVVAGFCLGSAGVTACATVAANWNRLADVQSRADIKAGLIMLVYGVGALAYAWRHPVAERQIVNVQPACKSSAKVTEIANYIPKMSTAIPGYFYVPVTFIVQGNPAKIVKQLESAGWTNVKAADFFSRGMADPVFPAFIDGIPAAHTLQQRAEWGRRIVRFWKTSLIANAQELWLGSIVEQVHERKWGRIDVYHQSPDVDMARDHLAEDLAGFAPKRITDFRKRGLYKWKNEFFTDGKALLFQLDHTGGSPLISLTNIRTDKAVSTNMGEPVK